MPTVLILYAHTEETSFNYALLEAAKSKLTSQGHKVIVSDLYKMGFNPVLSKQDATDYSGDRFHYPTEMGKAFERGTLANDIKAEQKKVTEADLIIFQFPLQWCSMPAIMKGWMEKVLTEGFSFVPAQGKLFDFGILKGKKTVLSVTTGSGAGGYSPCGALGDINCILWPIHISLYFVGLEVLKPHLSYAPGHAGQEGRESMLKTWSSRLTGLLEEKPLFFPSLTNMRPAATGGFELPPDFKREGDSEGEFAVTPGQHMNRRIHMDS